MSADDRRFHQGQFRRRMQGSGLLVSIAVLLFAGGYYLSLHPSPILFTAWLLALFVMLLCTLLLAVIDGLLSRHRLRGGLETLQRQRLVLEQKKRAMEEVQSRESRVEGPESGNGRAKG